MPRLLRRGVSLKLMVTLAAPDFFLDSKSTNFTRKTASNLKAIEEIIVTGIEKSDY